MDSDPRKWISNKEIGGLEDIRALQREDYDEKEDVQEGAVLR